MDAFHAGMKSPGEVAQLACDAAAPAMPWKTGVLKGHPMGMLTDSAEMKVDGAVVTIAVAVTRTVPVAARHFFRVREE